MFISADWLIWQWRDQSDSLSASNSREILCKLGIVTWSNSTEAGHAAGENISSESEELGQALLDVRSESWWLFQWDSKGIDCIGKARHYERHREFRCYQSQVLFMVWSLSHSFWDLPYIFFSVIFWLWALWGWVWGLLFLTTCLHRDFCKRLLILTEY